MQVLTVPGAHAAGPLDLDGHNASIRTLDDEVNLLPTSRRPEVGDTRLVVRGLGAHRDRDQPLEQRREQSAVGGRSRFPLAPRQDEAAPGHQRGKLAPRSCAAKAGSAS